MGNFFPFLRLSSRIFRCSGDFLANFSENSWNVGSYWRLQETIGLSDFGSRPQSIGLSEIGLNYWLPTSGHNIEREITTFGKGQIMGGGGGSARSTGGQSKGRSNCPFLWGGGGESKLTPPLSNHLSPSVCRGLFNRRRTDCLSSGKWTSVDLCFSFYSVPVIYFVTVKAYLVSSALLKTLDVLF